MLRDPQDKDALDKALAALKEFSAREDSSAGEGSRPRSGEPIFRIVGAAELKKLGAHGQAAFYLEAAAGYAFGRDLTGEPVTPHKDRGTHGYMPTRPNYRASFVASGRGVARRGSLGTINMTDIGPTVAHSLGLKLRDAEGRALRLH